MREHSFKRAILFGILGALIFLIVGFVLTVVFPSLEDTFLFKVYEADLDVKAVAFQIRFTVFVIIGFTAGWGHCLFRGTRRAKKRREDDK